MNKHPPAYATCYSCDTEYEVSELTIDNLEEDVLGRDTIFFTCPECGDKVKALVWTR